MNNLMITHGGALGDNGYTIPALWELRKRYDNIYLYGLQQAVMALEPLGIIDKFIVRPRFWKDSDEDKRSKLENALYGLEFEDTLNFDAVIPGVYMYPREHKGWHYSKNDKIEAAKGVNFFDVMSEHAETPLAVGKRPRLNITESERNSLQYFRADLGIPEDAFLIAWQFTGSTAIKWYPFFREVMQQGMMARYSDVYVLGLGDTNNLIKWSHEAHGGRFINPGSSISFREATLLTSICDLLVAPETGVHVFAQAFPELPKILLATHTSGEHICCGDENIIIASKAKCAPCYNIHCNPDGSYKRARGKPWSACMAKIAPQRVFMAIEEIYERWRDGSKSKHGRVDLAVAN